MTLMTIEIPYAPREAFKAFHESKKRWSVLCCHRRAGKTVASLNHLIRDAVQKRQGRYAFLEPTYKIAKRVVWDYVKHYSTSIPGMQYNEAELTAIFPNGAKLMLLGADSPDSLRGLSLDGVVFDEYSQQPPNIFGEIIRPALADRQGYGIWIGTIIGKNHLWRLHDEHQNDPEWFCVYLTASASKIIPEDELEAMKKQMSEEEYEQELELNPQAAVKGAYYVEQLKEARKESRITKVPYDPLLPVNTYWDLGIGDKTFVGFFQETGTQARLIDCLEGTGKGLDYYVRLLKEKNYIYGTHRFPHDVQVRELGSGRSRLEILKGLISDPIEVVKMIPVQDGINAVRMRFKSLWIDEERCSAVIQALEQYRKEWNDDHGVYKDRPLHDWTSHAADMMRYWAVTEDAFSLKASVRKDFEFTGATTTY